MGGRERAARCAVDGPHLAETTMGYIGWSPTEGAEVVSKIAGAEQTADELAERRRAREAV